jgi:hypothetical protein
MTSQNINLRIFEEVERYDVTFNVRNLNSAVEKLPLHILEFLHCHLLEKNIMYIDSYFVFKMPV